MRYFLVGLILFCALSSPANAAGAGYTITIKDASSDILKRQRCSIKETCSFTVDVNDKLIDVHINFHQTDFGMGFLHKGVTLWVNSSGQNSLDLGPDIFGNAETAITLYAPILGTDNDRLVLNPVWNKSNTIVGRFNIEIKKDR